VRLLDRLEEWIIVALMATATLLIFASVLHRYGSGVAFLQPVLLGINMSWAQELCIYMFIWMAKFGAAYGVRTGIHVGVDVVLRRLRGNAYRGLVVFGLLSGALFTGIVGTMGASFVWKIAHTTQVSEDLEIPMWIVYLAIPLGSYLMCFRFLQVAWGFLHGIPLPHHEPGQGPAGGSPGAHEA
jgi:C4-dicarboxylate transporter, DctQ subunit